MFFHEPAVGIRWRGRLLFITILLLQGVADAESRKATTPAERVLHFPPDRCLGCLKIYKGSITNGDDVPAIGESESSWRSWDYFGEAQGDVAVPADALLSLAMGPKNLKSLAHLRRLKPEDLHGLTIDCMINPVARGDQTVMPYLSGLTGLRDLSLFGVSITGSGLQHLGRLHALKSLIIKTDGSLDAGLKYLAKLKSLDRLELDGRCTDAGLQGLVGAARLRELVLNIGDLEGPGLAYLEKLPALRALTLVGPTFSDKGLAHIRNLTSLTRLHLFCLRGEWQVTDAGLAHLSGLTALEELEFTHPSHISDAGMVHLKPLRSLKTLKLGGAPISEAGLAQLEGTKTLETLLDPARVSDEGLAFLARSFRLRALGLHGAQISDAGVRELAAMRSLQDLSLHDTEITDAGIDSIAQLTNLQKLGLWGPSLRTRTARGSVDSLLTDRGLAKLAPLKSLSSLFLRNAKITMSGLSHLNELRNLTLLNLGDVEQDNTVMNISGLARLEQLTIYPAKDSRIHDEDLACLAGLKYLQNLQFVWPDRNTIGDRGVAYLAGLINLDRLVIGSRVTDVGLGRLRNMRKLNLLSVQGDFTDEGLRYLENLKSLAHLRLNPERPLSSAALRRLQDSLPNLYSFNVTDKQAGEKVDGKQQRRKKDE